MPLLGWPRAMPQRERKRRAPPVFKHRGLQFDEFGVGRRGGGAAAAPPHLAHDQKRKGGRQLNR